MICDVCGLRDAYRGQGDGIGSCDCPRCGCGAARGSSLCSCPLDEDGEWDCRCGDVCTCDWDDDAPWPVATARPSGTNR